MNSWQRFSSILSHLLTLINCFLWCAEISSWCDPVNSTGADFDQKILVFVLQMEKSKHSMWMGWSRIALLRKGESSVLPGEEREEEEGGVHQQRERAFYTTPWEGRPRRFPNPIMNKWGGAWAVPSQLRVVWLIPRQPTWAPKFCYF
jgi:hypothetical protein